MTQICMEIAIQEANSPHLQKEQKSSSTHVDAPKLKVLVCGGRDFNKPSLLRNYLDYYHAKWIIDVVIQGGATGADYVAKVWAEDNNVINEEYPANWTKYDRAAGHIRNKQMLDEGHPSVVIATVGGVGTANMIKQAKQRGIKVIHI